MAVKPYDLKQVVCNFGPVIFKGFAEGSAISITFEANIFDSVVGADGETTRSRTNNNNAKATVSLMQTSTAHAQMVLQTLRNAALSGILYPFYLASPLTGEVYESAQAYVEKLPDAGFEMAAGAREWVIYLPDCKQSPFEVLAI